MLSLTGSHKNTFLFLTLTFFSVSLVYLMKELLNTDDLLNAVLTEQVSAERLNEILRKQNKLSWLGYVAVPVLLFLKICTISAILWIGCFLFDKKIDYRSLFNITVKAEFIFLPVIICKTAWFYSIQTDYTLEDVQYFYPLSVLNIIGHQGLEPWHIYPLQILNVFEFMYWGLLIYLLAKALNTKPDKVFNIVAGSYGVGLLMWIITVMFLTINFS